MRKHVRRPDRGSSYEDELSYYSDVLSAVLWTTRQRNLIDARHPMLGFRPVRKGRPCSQNTERSPAAHSVSSLSGRAPTQCGALDSAHTKTQASG
jgi:hypothetical protein